MLIKNLPGKSPNDVSVVSRWSISSWSIVVSKPDQRRNRPQRLRTAKPNDHRLTANDQRLKLRPLSPQPPPANSPLSPRDRLRTRQASERSAFRLDTCPPKRRW